MHRNRGEYVFVWVRAPIDAVTYPFIVYSVTRSVTVDRSSLHQSHPSNRVGLPKHLGGIGWRQHDRNSIGTPLGQKSISFVDSPSLGRLSSLNEANVITERPMCWSVCLRLLLLLLLLWNFCSPSENCWSSKRLRNFSLFALFSQQQEFELMSIQRRGCKLRSNWPHKQTSHVFYLFFLFFVSWRKIWQEHWEYFPFSNGRLIDKLTKKKAS